MKRVHQWNDDAASEVEELMKTKAVHELFVTDPGASRNVTQSVIMFAEDHHLAFRYAADTVAARPDVASTTMTALSRIAVGSGNPVKLAHINH